MKKLSVLKTYTTILFALAVITIFFGIPFLVIAIIMPGSIPFKINGQSATDLSAFQQILAFTLFLGFGLFVYALYLFRQTLTLFEKNKVFDSIVIKNFDQMGKAILAGFIICGATMFTYNLTDGEISFDLDQIIKSVFVICLGLFFLVLSSVLERAKKLKEENDLTV